MRTILPSGPQGRDNRTSLGPAEALFEFAQRHPRTTAVIGGGMLGGVGAVPALALTQIALWGSSDFRIMKQEAKARYQERKANRFSAAGNTRRATKANNKANNIRQRIARM